jgi:hypothetical protein
MKFKVLTYAVLIGLPAAISVLPSDTINVALSIHEGTNMAAALSPDGKTLALHGHPMERRSLSSPIVTADGTSGRSGPMGRT